MIETAFSRCCAIDCACRARTGCFDTTRSAVISNGAPVVFNTNAGDVFTCPCWLVRDWVLPTLLLTLPQPSPPNPGLSTAMSHTMSTGSLPPGATSDASSLDGVLMGGIGEPRAVGMSHTVPTGDVIAEAEEAAASGAQRGRPAVASTTAAMHAAHTRQRPLNAPRDARFRVQPGSRVDTPAARADSDEDNPRHSPRPSHDDNADAASDASSEARRLMSNIMSGTSDEGGDELTDDGASSSAWERESAKLHMSHPKAVKASQALGWARQKSHSQRMTREGAKPPRAKAKVKPSTDRAQGAHTQREPSGPLGRRLHRGPIVDDVFTDDGGDVWANRKSASFHASRRSAGARAARGRGRRIGARTKSGVVRRRGPLLRGTAPGQGRRRQPLPAGRSVRIQPTPPPPQDDTSESSDTSTSANEDAAQPALTRNVSFSSDLSSDAVAVLSEFHRPSSNGSSTSSSSDDSDMSDAVSAILDEASQRASQKSLLAQQEREQLEALRKQSSATAKADPAPVRRPSPNSAANATHTARASKARKRPGSGTKKRAPAKSRPGSGRRKAKQSTVRAAAATTTSPSAAAANKTARPSSGTRRGKTARPSSGKRRGKALRARQPLAGTKSKATHRKATRPRPTRKPAPYQQARRQRPGMRARKMTVATQPEHRATPSPVHASVAEREAAAQLPDPASAHAHTAAPGEAESADPHKYIPQLGPYSHKRHWAHTLGARSKQHPYPQVPTPIAQPVQDARAHSVPAHRQAREVSFNAPSKTPVGNLTSAPSPLVSVLSGRPNVRILTPQHNLSASEFQTEAPRKESKVGPETPFICVWVGLTAAWFGVFCFVWVRWFVVAPGTPCGPWSIGSHVPHATPVPRGA